MPDFGRSAGTRLADRTCVRPQFGANLPREVYPTGSPLPTRPKRGVPINIALALPGTEGTDEGAKWLPNGREG
jgi:hypothetical protein